MHNTPNVNGQSNKNRFERTREYLTSLATPGLPLEQIARKTNRKKTKRRRQPRQNSSQSNNLSKDFKVRQGRNANGTPHYKNGGLPLSKAHKAAGIETISTAKMNRFIKDDFSETGINHDFEGSSQFPIIEPPKLSTGQGRFGDCILLAGTEVYKQLDVYTSTSTRPPPTAPGDIISSEFISPRALVETRLLEFSNLYTQFYLSHFEVVYIPLGNSTLSGALLSVPITDPQDVLGVNPNGEATIREAWSRKDATGGNVYKQMDFPFPELEDMDDPFYIQLGTDARLEIPWVHNIVALSAYPAEGTEPLRTIGWMLFKYVVEFYNNALTSSPLITETDHIDFQGEPFNNLFLGSGGTTAGDLLCGVVNTWWKFNEDSGVGRVYSRETWKTDGITDFLVQTTSHPPFTISQGMLLYAKLDSLLAAQCVLFYLTPNDAFNGTNPLVWAESPITTGIMAGYADFDFVSMDMNL